jgi:hypothetical protein
MGERKRERGIALSLSPISPLFALSPPCSLARAFSHEFLSLSLSLALSRARDLALALALSHALLSHA